MDERAKQLLVLGREHYGRREYERAEEALSQVLAVTDRYADVHNMFAVILHDRGDFAGAERHFERAVELNPNYTEALLNLAVTYNDLGKYESARRVYARIRRDDGLSTELDPFVAGKIANMHADVAQAYADAGKRPEAIEQLEKAVALCPRFADLQSRLGTLHRESDNFARARVHYEAAREANPQYAPARVLLGVTLLSLGEADLAVAEWREVLTIEPENRSAKMYLRMVEAQRNARASKAPPSLDSAPRSGAIAPEEPLG